MNKKAEHWDSVLRDGGVNVSAWEKETFYPYLLHASRSAEARVLEIGCGYGRMLKALRSDGAKAVMYGLDAFLDIHDSTYDLVKGDARAVPYKDNSFDVVFSLGVVEHFPETDSAIAEHFRVLKPGGTAIITVPHKSFSTPFRWAMYWLKYREYGTFEETLGRNLTSQELANMIQSGGGRIVAIRTAGFYLPGLSSLSNRLEKYLNPYSFFSSFLAVIAEKAR